MQHEAFLAKATLPPDEAEHRWFNILQMLAALVRLRIRRSHSPEARAQLAWVLEAVSTVARLQRGLGDARQAGMHAHLQDQALLWREIGREQRIAVRADLDPDAAIPGLAATPTALIVQELMANCFEHAFPDGQGGTVRISSHRREDGGAVIVVSDDGQGVREDEEPGDLGRSGLKIARSLADAIGAELSLTAARPKGTMARLHLPGP